MVKGSKAAGAAASAASLAASPNLPVDALLIVAGALAASVAIMCAVGKYKASNQQLAGRAMAVAWLALSAAMPMDERGQLAAGAALAALLRHVDLLEAVAIFSAWLLEQVLLRRAVPGIAALLPVVLFVAQWLPDLPMPRRRKEREAKDDNKEEKPKPVLSETLSQISGYSKPDESYSDSFKHSFVDESKDDLVAMYFVTVKLSISHYGRLYLTKSNVVFQGAMGIIQFTVPIKEVVEVRKPKDGFEQTTLILRSARQLWGSYPYHAVDFFFSEDGGPGVFASVLEHYQTEQAEHEDQDSRATLRRSLVPAASGTSAKWQADFGVDTPFATLFEGRVPGITAAEVAAGYLVEKWDMNEMVHLLWYEKAGMWDIEFGESVNESETVKLGELKYMAPCPPSNFAPDKTRVNVMLKATKLSDTEFWAEASAMSLDVPFGTNFMTQQRWTFKDTDEGLHFTYQSRCNFVKSVGWLKGTIESAVKDSMMTNSKILETILKEKAGGDSVAAAPESPAAVVAKLNTAWATDFDEVTAVWQELKQGTVPGIKAATIIGDYLQDKWADNNAHLMWYKKVGMWDLEVERVACEGNVAFAEVKYMCPVPPSSFAPDKTRVTVVIKATKVSDSELIADGSAMSLDVPFGTNFFTQNRWIFKDTPEGLHWSFNVRCNFVKAVGFLKGTINSNVVDTMTKNSIVLDECLKERRGNA